MIPANEIIRLENFAKKFGETEAVRGISLSINTGEMYGIVGPDGAGKTTTVRTMCALTSVYTGNVGILGMEARKYASEIHQIIGYLSQKFSLYGDLSINENIGFFAEIHGVKNYQNKRDELLEFTRLTEFRKRRADQLSGGMKQKLALACALIHKPKILFLDEPTTGVDPVSRRDFWKILNSLMEEKLTIILTTPYLDEAERCTRISMMNKGELIATGTVQEIKSELGKSALEISTTEIKRAANLLRSSLKSSPQMFGDRVFLLSANPYEEQESISLLLKQNGINATIRIMPPSLENVFIEKLGEQ